MNGHIELTQDELVQGEVYISACADVITEFAAKNKGKKLLVGIGMPGLKSKDKRGIVALANGPRMPLYAERVEQKLEERGIKLFSKIAVLGSDADYCGIGEEFAGEGEFKNCTNAYYLGGGTGIADAIKLNGKVIPFDEVKEWIAKTWEMIADSGLSLERYTSVSGIQFIYSRYSGILVEELNNKSVFPPQILDSAYNGDSNSLDTYNDISRNLSKLIFERITTLFFGWQNHFEFINPNKPKLICDHPFKGTFLDKIIIGQRLGELMKASKGSGILYDKVIDHLTELVKKTNDIQFKNHYLKEGNFNYKLIFFSNLREAPAIGAGIDAYFNKYK
jgi:predicted NBD/HSP70 family sugar kinase